MTTRSWTGYREVLLDCLWHLRQAVERAHHAATGKERRAERDVEVKDLWLALIQANQLVADGLAILAEGSGAPVDLKRGRVVQPRTEAEFRALIRREAAVLFMTARVFDDWRFDDTTATETRALTHAARALREASGHLMGGFSTDADTKTRCPRCGCTDGMHYSHCKGDATP